MEPGLDEREPAERSAEIPSVAGGSDVPAQPPTAGRTRLEALTVGAQVTGVDPCGPVRVIQDQWHGADCLDLTYRDTTGRTDSRLLNRNDEPSAAPHNGKEEDFQLFMSLLDADRFEGRFRDGVHVVDVSDLMRRKVKEDLLKSDGTPRFSERRACTVSYEHSDPEAALYHPQEISQSLDRRRKRLEERLLDERLQRRGAPKFSATSSMGVSPGTRSG